MAIISKMLTLNDSADTSDATVMAGEVFKDKVAYGPEGKLTGTAPFGLISEEGVQKSTLPKNRWYSVTYGNGKYVAAAPIDNTLAYSTDGVSWTAITLPSLVAPRGITYGNNKFVVVGGEAENSGGNIAAYSTDGVNWTETTLPSSHLWDYIAYGDGIFMAVANGYDKVVTSTNGRDWTEVALPSEDTWRGIIYGDNKFIIGGAGGTVIYSTDNGNTWTTITVPYNNYDSYGIAYGNGQLIVTSNGSYYAYTSDWGTTWHQGSGATGIDIIFANGKFILMSYYNGVYSVFCSTDGINWTQSDSPIEASFEAITYGKDKFVALQRYGNAVIFSSDGITWSDSIFTPGSYSVTSNNVTLSSGSSPKRELEVITEGDSSKIRFTDEIDSDEFSEYQATINQFNAAGITYKENEYLWRSNNKGIKSSTASIGLTAKQDCDVAFTYTYSSETKYDKLTITVGDETVADAVSGDNGATPIDYSGSLVSGKSISFSYKKDSSQDEYDDCATFSNFSIVVSGKTINITPDNIDTYFTVTNGTYTFVPEILEAGGVMIDNENLTPENIKRDVTIFNVTGKMLGAAPNGAEWTKAAQIGVSDVKYGNNIWVLLSYASFSSDRNPETDGVYYSEDGKNWTKSNLTGSDYTGLNFVNGMFFVTHQPQSYYSKDGKTWTACSNYFEADQTVFCRGKYFAWGTTGTGDYKNALLYSLDGITWSHTAQINGFQGSMNDIQVYNGILYTLDRNNYIGVGTSAASVSHKLTSSIYDGLDHFAFLDKASEPTKDGVCVAYSTYAKIGIIYSDDKGETWNESNFPKHVCAKIVSGNGILVAGDDTDDKIYYSTDGKTWNLSNIQDSSFSQMTFDNGVFVGMLSNYKVGYYIIYSKDGKTWEKTPYTSYPGFDPYYANGVWITLDGNKARILYSVDNGIHWHKSKVNPPGTYLYISFTGKHLPLKYANGIWVFGQEFKSNLDEPYYQSGVEYSIGYDSSFLRNALMLPSQKNNLNYTGNQLSPTWEDCDLNNFTISGTTKAINPGTYVATFTLKEGYKWDDDTTEPKDISWRINKGNPNLTASSDSITVSGTTPGTITLSRVGGGELTVREWDSALIDVSLSGTTLTITPKGTAGTTYIYITCQSTELYDTQSTFIDVTVTSGNTPKELQQAARSGQAANLYSVGDKIPIAINGTFGSTTINDTFYAVILGFDHNSSVEGGNSIHFQIGKNDRGTNIAFVDTGYNSYYSNNANSRFVMNATETNSGGWKNSYMRQTICTEFLAALPAEWQDVITACTKYSDNTGGGNDTASYVTATQDKIWLLSEFEVFGTRTEANSAEQNYQKQYDYYKNGGSKVKYKHDTGSTCNWWLRSVSTNDTSTFRNVTISGVGATYNGIRSIGFAPCFMIA